MDRPRARVATVAIALVALALFGCTAATGAANDSTDEPASAAWSRMASGLEPLARAGDPATMERLARERGYVVVDRAVRVAVHTRGLDAGDRARFDIAGVRVVAFAPAYQRAGVWVSTPAALRALSRLPMVRRLAPGYGSASGG